jgi:hypothetical protein
MGIGMVVALSLRLVDRANGGHGPYFGQIAPLEILTAASAVIWLLLPLKQGKGLK